MPLFAHVIRLQNHPSNNLTNLIYMFLYFSIFSSKLNFHYQNFKLLWSLNCREVENVFFCFCFFFNIKTNVIKTTQFKIWIRFTFLKRDLNFDTEEKRTLNKEGHQFHTSHFFRGLGCDNVNVNLLFV